MKLFTSFRIKAFAYTIAFLFPALTFSQTNTWNPAGAGANNWNNINKWSLGILPTAAHDVVISSSVSISVNVNPGTIKSLTVNGSANVTLANNGGSKSITIGNNGSTIAAGSTLSIIGVTGTGGVRSLTLQYLAGGTRTMTIAGILNVDIVSNDPGIYNATNSATTVTGTINNNDGTIISTAANLSFSAGATYNHQTDGNGIPFATWDATSNCNVSGIINTVFTGLNQSFGNLTWDCIGQTGGFNFANLLTSVQGNLTIGNTNTAGLFMGTNNGSTYTLTIGGNLTINDNAWFGITNGDNITATVNVGGNFSMSGATINSTFFDFHIATGGTITLGKIIMNVAGNFSQSGGLFDFASGESDAANFTELWVGGDFSHSGVAGMFTSTSDNSITNGTITFNKNGTQTLQIGTLGNLIYTNFVVDNNSTTQLLSGISLTSEATAVWGGKFTVNSGGILNAGTNQILSSTGAVAGVNNSFTLNSGAGLITANTNGVQNANVGTVSTSLATRTFSSGANYTYNNVSAIQNSGIFTTTTPNLINNLTINNTAGAGTTGVTLQQPIAVAGVLTLTSGHITTNSTNLLTLNSAASASYTSGSTSSFVNGPIAKVGTTAFTFPVGKVNAGMREIGISAPSTPSASTTFQAEFMRAPSPNRGSVLSPITQVSACEYWTLDRTGSANVAVTLFWNSNSPCNGALYVTNLGDLQVARYNSSQWTSEGNAVTTGTNISGTITSGVVSSFSPFSLGSKNSATNPLPVKLVDVKAYNTGNRNRIEWTNLTEIDVIAYEVERSLNGTQFTSMASLAARGNANDKENYYEYDVQAVSVTYYRIKVTSRDGKIIYSPIVKVATNLTVKQDIVLYPNPVTGKQFTMQMNSAAGDYYVKIYSANGQIVKTETLKHPGGSYAKTIELPGQLQAGQYYMQVSGGEKILTTKFIVQ